MNEPALSSSALEVLAIVDASETFRSTMRREPELRTRLIEAADAALSSPFHARLLEVLTIATSAADKSVDAVCAGDVAELAKWNCICTEACEELGQLLKQLCRWATPIESNAVDAPS